MFVILALQTFYKSHLIHGSYQLRLNYILRIFILASNPWMFAATSLFLTPLMHLNKTAYMNGLKVFTVPQDNSGREYPTMNWHILEAFDIRSPSLRQVYEERNEEYYKQLDAKTNYRNRETEV